MKPFKLGPIQKKWIKTLKEHPERQMRNRLGRRRFETSTEFRACCLGQGGLIAGVCTWIDNNLVARLDENHTVLSRGTYARLGLYSDVGAPKHGYYAMPDLSEMNDTTKDGMQCFDWPHIAVILETFPEIYFKESV